MPYLILQRKQGTGAPPTTSGDFDSFSWDATLSWNQSGVNSIETHRQSFDISSTGIYQIDAALVTGLYRFYRRRFDLDTFSGSLSAANSVGSSYIPPILGGVAVTGGVAYGVYYFGSNSRSYIMNLMTGATIWDTTAIFWAMEGAKTENSLFFVPQGGTAIWKYSTTGSYQGQIALGFTFKNMQSYGAHLYVLGTDNVVRKYTTADRVLVDTFDLSSHSPACCAVYGEDKFLFNSGNVIYSKNGTGPILEEGTVGQTFRYMRVDPNRPVIYGSISNLRVYRVT